MTLRSRDRYVPTDTLRSRLREGLDMACIKSSFNQWFVIELYD